MKTIITEEMRYRERVVQYAIKSNNAVAARRYHTSRQQVQRWRKKYDGTTASLRYLNMQHLFELEKEGINEQKSTG